LSLGCPLFLAVDLGQESVFSPKLLRGLYVKFGLTLLFSLRDRGWILPGGIGNPCSSKSSSPSSFSGLPPSIGTRRCLVHPGKLEGRKPQAFVQKPEKHKDCLLSKFINLSSYKFVSSCFCVSDRICCYLRLKFVGSTVRKISQSITFMSCSLLYNLCTYVYVFCCSIMSCKCSSVTSQQPNPQHQ
jgi:hypothetical protein